MADIPTTPKTRCTVCEKERSGVRCEGCLQIFCYVHLTDHRQDLDKQLNEIEMNRDEFREILTRQLADMDNHSLVGEIDRWKEESIKKIEQIAEECKQQVVLYTAEHMQQIELNLTKLTEELRYIRQENDFNELDLTQLTNKLKQLQRDLQQPATCSIKKDATSFIEGISIDHHHHQQITTEQQLSSCIDNSINECPMCYWEFPLHMLLAMKREHIENHFA